MVSLKVRPLLIPGPTASTSAATQSVPSAVAPAKENRKVLGKPEHGVNFNEFLELIAGNEEWVENMYI